MIIKPRIRGFICTTAHPVGCTRHIQAHIDWVKNQSAIQGPKNVLVIGASAGYGLASRIVASFGAGAGTIGVFFERPASGSRTASAGWYNSVAFQQAARDAGYTAENINGDAFSDEIKAETIKKIKATLGQVDLVIYSLASPRRTHPATGETFASVLKPIGQPYTNKTVDIHSGEVSEITIKPASEEEIQHTVAVMGGEDWTFWIQTLRQADVLAPDARTIAYSYIGPELTYPMYRAGAIGRAKDHLEATARELNAELQKTGGAALVSVNKAVVTQSSSAIPVVPLYIALLFKIMKDNSTHEGCIEQMYRLFAERLYTGGETPVDNEGRIRIDDLEMQDDIQAQVSTRWSQVSTDNLANLSDIQSYQDEFLKLFGFGVEGVDYDADVEP